jgi:hypothetical protein
LWRRDWGSVPLWLLKAMSSMASSNFLKTCMRVERSS